MKKHLLLSVLSLLSITLMAQLHHIKRANTVEPSELFNPILAPFYHGVASGDPTENSVILWTRLTTEEEITNLLVTVATDTNMVNEVANIYAVAESSSDYTVKVNATGLEPGKTYYYQFRVLNGPLSDNRSMVGRAKTLPAAGVEHLRFAVVSCSNYEQGFFNAYGRIADRNDIDAVIHLGDYIYEYEVGQYGDTSLGRYNYPEEEIVEVEDYRARYALYRLDPDLIKLHQQHTFLSIWDDHESANDAFKDGAENHQPATEGDWETRKSNAKTAYFEWLPIRENAEQNIYKTVSYGDLADIILLDTRIEGREKQPTSMADDDFNDPRTILGAEQKDWFLTELKSSSAKWKVVANQVIFSPLNLGFAAGALQGAPDPTDSAKVYDVENGFLDIWDGYPYERKQIIDTITANNIDNVIVLTGDFHSTFAFDVTYAPVLYPLKQAFYLPQPSPTYNPVTGEGSAAVEFATPSITSANFDENIPVPSLVQQFQYAMNNYIPIPPNQTAQVFNYNPHMKYVDLVNNGYFILDLKEDSAQANWYFVETVDSPSEIETFANAQKTIAGGNHLITSTESAEKTTQDKPAPTPTDVINALYKEQEEALIVSAYPNPTSNYITVAYALSQSSAVEISIKNVNGVSVKTIFNGSQAAGMYEYQANLQDLSSGIYFFSIEKEGESITKKIVKE